MRIDSDPLSHVSLIEQSFDICRFSTANNGDWVRLGDIHRFISILPPFGHIYKVAMYEFPTFTGKIISFHGGIVESP